MSLRIRDAAPAYLPAPATNSDAAYYDFMAVLHAMLRITLWPYGQLEALVERIEGQPQPLDGLTVRQLMVLVAAAQPATAPAGDAGHALVDTHHKEHHA